MPVVACNAAGAWKRAEVILGDSGCRSWFSAGSLTCVAHSGSLLVSKRYTTAAAAIAVAGDKDEQTAT
jgi:hypothetical protein